VVWAAFIQAYGLQRCRRAVGHYHDTHPGGVLRAGRGIAGSRCSNFAETAELEQRARFDKCGECRDEADASASKIADLLSKRIWAFNTVATARPNRLSPQRSLKYLQTVGQNAWLDAQVRWRLQLTSASADLSQPGLTTAV